MSPNDFPSPDPAHAQEELREGIEFSRVLVRQSRMLIELSESDGAFPVDEDDYSIAN